MEWLLALSTVLFAITITPGPNNLILMQAGARGDIARAAAIVLGIQLGGLVILLAVWAGLMQWGSKAGDISRYLEWGSASLLCLLGYMMIRAGAGDGKAAAVPGFWALLLLQLINPKSWMLVVGVAVFLPKGDGFWHGILPFLTLFILVPLSSQIIWLGLGKGLQQGFQRFPGAEIWFSRGAGLVLIAFAGLTLLG